MKRTSPRAFSLVEVVVAVGVFVAGVVAAVALLSQTTDAAGQRLRASVAGRVAESSVVLIRQLSWEEVVSVLTDGTTKLANRDGTEIGWVDDVAEADAYYAMAINRNEALSPETADDSAAVLVLRLEVRWPIWQSTGQPVEAEDQERLIFNFAVNR